MIVFDVLLCKSLDEVYFDWDAFSQCFVLIGHSKYEKLFNIFHKNDTSYIEKTRYCSKCSTPNTVA